MSKLFVVAAVVMSALAFIAAPPVARAMTVQPVVIDLKPTGHGSTATVTVQNSFTTPLPVELTVQSLDFDENGVHQTGKDPGDLLIFPAQTLIAPGQTQAFRIQWVGDPVLEKSQHYYVTVAQLPVQLPEGQSAIQILYNFQVLVNVAASTGGPQISIDSATIGKNDKGQPVPLLVVRNAGNSYGYLSRVRIRITYKDATGKETFRQVMTPEQIQQQVGFGLIGPETTRKVTLPVVLPGADGAVHVELLDAKGR
ncbi:MAG TPA: fimbria/pilus periplasmic chaperone [Caulobacteraceae bacterium]|jgi:fimbrial chaperone protein|nr:fimbria/pilus periplasmic chaperone [Caulobacteraceae bacterium]